MLLHNRKARSKRTPQRIPIHLPCNTNNKRNHSSGRRSRKTAAVPNVLPTRNLDPGARIEAIMRPERSLEATRVQENRGGEAGNKNKHRGENQFFLYY